MNRKPNRFALIVLLGLLVASFATYIIRDKTPTAPSVAEVPVVNPHRVMLEVGNLTEGEPETTDPKAAAVVTPATDKVSAVPTSASVRF